MNPLQDDGAWFFRALDASFKRLEENQRVLLQELCYTSEQRRLVCEDLAETFLRTGLLVPSFQGKPAHMKAISHLIASKLLAEVLGMLISGTVWSLEDLQEWTIQQQGWYGDQGKPLEKEKEQKDDSGKSKDTLPPLSAGSTRPWRSTRSNRPGRFARGTGGDPSEPL